jgi:hypothetical protein
MISLASTLLDGDMRVYFLRKNDHIVEYAYHTDGNKWIFRYMTGEVVH